VKSIKIKYKFEKNHRNQHLITSQLTSSIQ